MLVNAAAAVLAMVVMLAVGRLAFGVGLPDNIAGYLLTWVLGAAALLSIGTFIAAVASGSKVANAVGAILFFPMMFFAGLWLPREQMPSLLRHISDYTPLGALVRGLQASWAGDWPSGSTLPVLAGYAVVVGLLAVRFFRWE